MKNNKREQLLKKCIEGDIDLRDNLELFTVFISSNPSFKYNQTYLSDSIGPFLKVIPILRKKFISFKKLAEKLANQTPFEFKGAIVFDSFFVFEINYSISSDFKFYNIDNFRLDNLKEDEFTVKFVWEANKDLKRTEIKKLDMRDKQKVVRHWTNFIKQFELR